MLETTGSFIANEPRTRIKRDLIHLINLDIVGEMELVELIYFLVLFGSFSMYLLYLTDGESA